MFLCGNFCNGPPDQKNSEIIVERKDYQRFSEANSHLSQKEESTNKARVMVRTSNYNQLHAECRKNNKQFIDKDFPCNQQSLNYSIHNREITWKRIPEILHHDIVMAENGVNPAQIQQCNMGDCYFLAAVSAMAETPLAVENIFLKNFAVNGHGIYKVIANWEGVISEVVIDDFVPVFSTTNRPVFCKANGREIWPMLLEKAWAKIKGSYGEIASGTPHQVLNTFSLAPCFNYQIHQHSSDDHKDLLWTKLQEIQEFTLPACAGSNREVTINGLKPLHTYPLLKCISIPFNGKNHRMVKLRNPWGDTQYHGFGSQSDEKFWNNIPRQKRQAILPSESNTEQFVLPYSEFVKNFEVIDICHTRSNFHYEFQTLSLTRHEPLFVKLEIEEPHEAYITLEKVYANHEDKVMVNQSGHHGYLRVIIAREEGKDHYEYFDSKLETTFGDLSIRCNFKAGKYVILVEADYPAKLNKFQVIFSYYYENHISSEKKKLAMINTNTNDLKNFKLLYLQTVLKNHAIRLSSDHDITKLSSKPNDRIRTKLLYEQGGYGYVAVSIDQASTFRLHITVDRTYLPIYNRKIQSNGFHLLTQTPDEFDVSAGSFQIYVFALDLTNKNIQQLSFPPSGFKISKIV